MERREMEVAATARGFYLVEFTDIYGSECSLQESSLADPAAIWFGVDKPFTDKTGGVRMHLSQEQVKELLPLLEHFAEWGYLPEKIETRPKLPLTERQQNVLDALRELIRQNGYAPTVRELCDAMGFKSTSTAFHYLKRLEKKGYIFRDATKPRAMRIL